MLKTCPLCMFFLFESIKIPILKGGVSRCPITWFISALLRIFFAIFFVDSISILIRVTYLEGISAR